MADLLINGTDALQTYGAHMSDDFLDNLGKPADNKEYIENDSPLEDGKQVITTGVKTDSRTLTLTFRITGTTHADYLTKKAAFEKMLHAGALTIQVPADSAAIYRLVFNKCTSYAQNRRRTSCKIAAQFTEPDPTNRSE